MAIRPADLQLAYLAAPQAAAAASQNQNAAQTAQQASQLAFAAHVREREESVEETSHVEGNVIRERGEQAQDRDGHRRERREPEEEPASFAGDGEHFIDVTA